MESGQLSVMQRDGEISMLRQRVATDSLSSWLEGRSLVCSSRNWMIEER